MADEKAKGKSVGIVPESSSDVALNRSIDEVLRTEAGRAVWAHLFNLCGYSVSSLSRKTDGEVAPLSTECKEAQRLVYIKLRARASKELLFAAEQLAETPSTITPAAAAAQPKEEERKN